ncbi:MAG TPA: hypothetical protein DCY27_13010 [Desulfobacterales bacterium]|nr:hypothetical protein [Desulfobacterales bacterium]
MASPASVPYLFDFHNIQIESLIGFILGMLFSVLFNAEGQAYLATVLGDRREAPKDRFHFNAFLHLDILGTAAFLLGGFGWPKQISVEEKNFPHPKLYTIITRLSGPLANLLAAGIAASMISILMALMQLHPQIFLGVVAVNVTVAVYNLIPIPPLAAGNCLVALLSDRLAPLKTKLQFIGPWVIVAFLVFERLYPTGIFEGYLNPLVRTVYGFITG